MLTAGFVLAGGRSTRMGRDKALLTLNGETLLERGLRQLAEVCAEVAIAGATEDLSRFGRVVRDAEPGRGPLGGIVAALGCTRFEWNLFVPVDVPFIPAEVWRRLLATAAEADALAVMARFGGQVQPLCAVYARQGWQGLKAELDAGRGKVTAAAAAAGPVLYVDFDGQDQERWFRNYNTPEEFSAIGG